MTTARANPHPCNPYERVTEFLRQWAIARDKGDGIYSINFDPSGPDLGIELTISDIQWLLDNVDWA